MILNYFNFFIPLLLLFSSIKVYGYVVCFFIFLPNVLKTFKNNYEQIYYFYKDNKLTTFYFIYFLIQSIIGSFSLNDIRIIIYWGIFFLVQFIALFKHNYNIKNNIFYKNNINSILLYSSLAYFILYLCFNIFSLFYFKNTYQIQDLFWIGSSTAFHISSIFLVSLFFNWKEKIFVIFSWNLLYYLFFIIIVDLNDSRLGFLYAILFTFFVFLENLRIRTFLNGFLILLIFLICNHTFSNIISSVKNDFQYYYYENINNVGELSKKEWKKNPPYKKKYFSSYFTYRSLDSSLFKKENKILKNQKDSNLEDKVILKNTRLIELLVGLDKFSNSSFLNKIFGSGWYSSRVTINTSRDKFVDFYKNKLDCDACFVKKDVNSLQGIVAIILDSGLIGLLLILYFYVLNFKAIFNSSLKINNKFFLISMLGLNFFCLFIGYPLNSIMFSLYFLPKGLTYLESN